MRQPLAVRQIPFVHTFHPSDSTFRLVRTLALQYSSTPSPALEGERPREPPCPQKTSASLRDYRLAVSAKITSSSVIIPNTAPLSRSLTSASG